jgi:exosome complex component RRP45
MTAIVNSNGDVCAIQKAGGEGLMSSVTMQYLETLRSSQTIR